jgi:RNA polymerase sigma factor (sigma-70 family)
MIAAPMDMGTPDDGASTSRPEDLLEVWPGSTEAPGDGDATDHEDPEHACPMVSAPALVPRATDAQLAAWIDAIVDQDERALAALYDATFTRVFGIVKRIVRRTALAEEVVEETYFQVWRQAVRFDPARGKALTWLMAIARSRAIDALRQEARFRHEPMDDEHDAQAADEARPSDELLDLARHQADLHQALMRLGAQPRQLVSLAFFRGLSHEEIAQQTCLPLGTVKSQIRRALSTLRQILGEGGAAALAS